MDPHRRSASLTFTLNGIGPEQREEDGLMQNYDVEQGAFGLTDLVDDPEDLPVDNSRHRRTSGERITRYHERPSSKSLDR